MLSLKEKKKKRVKENNPLDPVSLALGQGQGQHCSRSLRAPWPRDAQSDSYHCQQLHPSVQN